MVSGSEPVRLSRRCYGHSVIVEDVPLALSRSFAQRRVVIVVHVLKIRLQRQPMLLKHVALQMLRERSDDHSRLDILNPEGFPGRNFSGLHEGINDELLLRFAMGVAEPVQALVSHTNKLRELGFALLIFGWLLILVIIIPGLDLLNRRLLRASRGYRKE